MAGSFSLFGYLRSSKLASASALVLWTQGAVAQALPSPGATLTAPPSEDLLGEFVVTGTVAEHIPKIAVLPSLSPALQDVIVRSVVRRDLELSGMFQMIPDEKAPPGTYGFSDPVDVAAWQNLGAEAVVKVSARSHESGGIEVLGLAYFPSAGKEPVYQTRLVVGKDEARQTAHKITDDLLGALTGRPGGFSSRFAFSAPWGRNLRVFVADSDGYALTPHSDEKATAIAPTFGLNDELYFSISQNYSPFKLQSRSTQNTESASKTLEVGFTGSIYSSAFSHDKARLALAVAQDARSAIYVGSADGKDLKRVSSTDLATHPAFSPEGQLAWVGGDAEQNSQRVYVDGKAVSPSGFMASAPTFCDTEDGVFLIYAVGVGHDRQDLVMSRPDGRGLVRLTQNQGSNSYPACSPDGRLLAFFSTRKDDKGLFVLSLKRFTTKKILGTVGQSLRWVATPRSDLLQGPSKPLGAVAEKPPLAADPQGPGCGLAKAPELAKAP